jgi:hypothetical protein
MPLLETRPQLPGGVVRLNSQDVAPPAHIHPRHRPYSRFERLPKWDVYYQIWGNLQSRPQYYWLSKTTLCLGRMWPDDQKRQSRLMMRAAHDTLWRAPRHAVQVYMLYNLVVKLCVSVEE